MSAAAAGQLADFLIPQLEGAQAGSYYDAAARKLIVNVTTPTAADTVREAGAEPRTVRFAAAQLDATKAALDSSALIPGTAWGMDPVANRVVVTADPTVTDARLEMLHKVLKPFGETVELQRTDQELRAYSSAGDAVYASAKSSFRGRCSLGFNVKREGKPDAFLTAGHCGNPIKSWAEAEGGAEIALVPENGSKFPGDDYAIAVYTDASVARPSQVRRYVLPSLPVTGARDATTADKVSRSGASTGLHGIDAGEPGDVQALNQTVNYAEGRVTGLTRTNVCAEPSESGSPFWITNEDGTATAVGISSGGSGDCTHGGTTFFQPIMEALHAFGATIP
ncbi:S1 family peptidase [Streptomyces vinaceus]|nr:S1 family peptidase [Streptomyces vinaceus]GHE76131.1 serine protease [Streptomyces vinaceus]